MSVKQNPAQGSRAYAIVIQLEEGEWDLLASFVRSEQPAGMTLKRKDGTPSMECGTASNREWTVKYAYQPSSKNLMLNCTVAPSWATRTMVYLWIIAFVESVGRVVRQRARSLSDPEVGRT